MPKSSKNKSDRTSSRSSSARSSYESPSGRTGSGAGSGREGSPASWSSTMSSRGGRGGVKQGGQTRQSKAAARSAESRPTRSELSGRESSGSKRGKSGSGSKRGSAGSSTSRQESQRERGGRPMESVYGDDYRSFRGDRGGRDERDDRDDRGRGGDDRDREWNVSARFDEGRSIRGERGELGWRSEGQRYADEGREHHPRRSQRRDESDERSFPPGFRRDDRQEGWQQSEEFGFAGDGPRARERDDNFYRPPAGRDDGRWTGSGRYADAQGGYHGGRERDDRRGFDERYERSGRDERGGRSWSERGHEETQGYGHRADDFGGGDRGSQDFYRGRGARGEQDTRRGSGPSRRNFSQRSSRSGNRYE